jgi:lipopolysaccharide transport system permease protein/teichoic acid transport system permease protein
MTRNAVTNWFLNVARYRETILAMSARDVRGRYAGTFGGMIWAFVHPAAIVAIFYFVFAVGFRAHGPGNIPFILWFVSGLAPWFFFNDTLVVITNSVMTNSYLVAKTVFPTEILPLIYILSGLFPHLIFLGLLGGLDFYFHLPFSSARLLVVYFTGCTIMLLLGLGWLFCALQVFYRDVAQALTITLNMLFWLTPIVWSQDIVPAAYQGVLQANPIYYIVQGYRGLLIYPQPVWPSLAQTITFWVITLAALMTGALIFRQLKPEFADVM